MELGVVLSCDVCLRPSAQRHCLSYDFFFSLRWNGLTGRTVVQQALRYGGAGSTSVESGARPTTARGVCVTGSVSGGAGDREAAGCGAYTGQRNVSPIAGEGGEEHARRSVEQSSCYRKDTDAEILRGSVVVEG
ncbi:hypothetical protein K505DRAFT_422938 [Melanomma pulvis-pyrius CBS 109.77]|uniref:Uncharacterized protein n=1 Tax=Melanomma pulvis-pyrius CBS 109.77 TaxID=1314802 RepID=A0A6A6WNH2_9PLEO|nr:hypothetical protein K505DRAFT_422938 [Melanomma pulvis-pyrius CBS 109.77]